MGDYQNPLTLNAWNYTSSNPINYTDPSGYYPVCDDGKCSYQSPDWWVNQTQIYVQELGYLDSGHLGRGWDNAKFFVTAIEVALGRGHAGMLPISRAKSGTHYWVDYAVSSKITTKNQIYGVAYGMLVDFERGYEKYQDRTILPPRFLSGFAPGDLPSDHFGFWAYTNGYDRDQIPTMLQCFGEVEVLVPQLFGIVGFYENHEFLPMIRERTVGSGYILKNIAWPAFLEIQPIPSGPNTWQVKNRSR